MTTYLCLDCNTLHGWHDSENVIEIKRFNQLPAESIWWCPSCEREHRTTDGTIFGQLHKRYVEVPENKLNEVLEITYQLARTAWFGADFYIGPFDTISELKEAGIINE